jgi:hypothetical protein
LFWEHILNADRERERKKERERMRKTYLQIVIISILSLLGIFYAYTNYLASINSEIIRNEKQFVQPDNVQHVIEEKVIYITKTIEKSNCDETKKNETVSNKTTPALNENKYDYFKRYPFFKECKQNYSFWPDAADSNYDFSRPAPNSTHDVRLTRAVLVYFPVEKINEYELEFRWFYRSWIEMQKYEPTKWRTDLVVFIDNEPEVFKNDKLFFKELNCSFDFKRNNSQQGPMCTLFEYKTLKKRSIKGQSDIFKQLTSQKETYEYLLSKLDIFSNDSNNLEPFYKLLFDNLSNYGYLDSILMAFDGYDYFKSAGFDFLIRSDMDVFLTPLFGKWIPRFCYEFYCGRGAYSTNFNMNRLKRIAENLNLNFGNVRNLGSTWYSTPNQFRLVSYLTLFGMAYLNQEEFSSTEREGKLGVLMWPVSFFPSFFFVF